MIFHDRMAINKLIHNIRMNKKDQENNDIVYEETDKKAKNKASNDIVIDDEFEAPDLPAQAGALVKKLKEKIKTLEKEKQEYMDGWQRERADFVNYKKRVENEKLEVIKYANEGLVEELLPVLNSFEMAFANKEAWEKVDKNWRIGVEYIHSQFIKILDENGIKEIKALGEKFDPRFHVAVEHKETNDEKKDGIITEVKKKGYMVNDRVIVASQVVVAEYKK